MTGNRNSQAPRKDVYARITDRIIQDLEKGVRRWLKPWSVEHAEGRIIRPLRHSSQPYAGINVLMLWSVAAEQGFDSQTWMTYRQAVRRESRMKEWPMGP